MEIAAIAAIVAAFALGVAVGTSGGETYWRSKIASECFDQMEFGAWELIQANDSRHRRTPVRAARRRGNGPPAPPPKP